MCRVLISYVSSWHLSECWLLRADCWMRRECGRRECETAGGMWECVGLRIGSWKRGNEDWNLKVYWSFLCECPGQVSVGSDSSVWCPASPPTMFSLNLRNKSLPLSGRCVLCCPVPSILVDVACVDVSCLPVAGGLAYLYRLWLFRPLHNWYTYPGSLVRGASI